MHIFQFKQHTIEQTQYNMGQYSHSCGTVLIQLWDSTHTTMGIDKDNYGDKLKLIPNINTVCPQ